MIDLEINDGSIIKDIMTSSKHFGDNRSAYEESERICNELKKYGGKLEQDIHYVVKDGKIVFPHTLENPYKTKPYLSKVLKTIMDNAGVGFKLVDVEQDVEAPKAVEKPKVEAIPSLSYTADTKDKAEKPALPTLTSEE